jgi:predicted RND superfamily exporter protein
VNLILKFSRGILIVAAFFAAFSLFKAKDIGFEYNLEVFFPADDPDVAYMARFREKLERDDLFLLVAIDHTQSIYDTAFLQQLEDFTKSCRQLPLIKQAESIATIREPIRTPFGMSFRKILHNNQPEQLPSDSLLIASDERFRNTLVSANHQAVTINLKTIGQLSQNEAYSLQSDLLQLLAKFGFEKYHIAGGAITQAVFVSKIKEELVLYIGLSIVIVTIILFFLFRTFWGIAIPLASVIVALAVFLGYLAVTNQAFDIMSTMFPTLMLIFGMSDVIHLQSKYIDELERGKNSADAMRVAFKEIGTALLLTSVTTAIGFASLLASSIPAIQRFGINAAVGVLIAYIMVILFAGAALSLTKLSQLQRVKHQKDNWRRYTLSLYLQNRKYPKLIFSGVMAIILLSIYGINQISTNSYLLGDIPKNSVLRQDFQFFEDNFAGVRPIEIAILPGIGKKVLDADVLLATEKFGEYLSQNFQIGALQSPAVLLKSVHKSWQGGQQSAYRLPEKDDELMPLLKFMRQNQHHSTYKLWSLDEQLGRISARIRDTGSDSLGLEMEQIRQWVRQNIDLSVVDFVITGSVLLVDKNHAYLRKNLFQSLGVAFILVGIIFALLFRDWRMVLVSIVPNILPMLIAGAALGFTGIELKAVTAVIFTVSFGIAVDDTIHFLTRYKLERTKGRSVDAALRQTFLVSVKAITITTIVLIFGFISLIFSSFTGTYYVGILVCITLLSALAADVYLIPQLLYWINPGSRPKAENRNEA